jgi:hypothetical protein
MAMQSNKGRHHNIVAEDLMQRQLRITIMNQSPILLNSQHHNLYCRGGIDA